MLKGKEECEEEKMKKKEYEEEEVRKKERKRVNRER